VGLTKSSLIFQFGFDEAVRKTLRKGAAAPPHSHLRFALVAAASCSTTRSTSAFVMAGNRSRVSVRLRSSRPLQANTVAPVWIKGQRTVGRIEIKIVPPLKLIMGNILENQNVGKMPL
jgi:hypothetical protein